MLKFCMLLWEFIIHAPGSKRIGYHPRRIVADRRVANRQSDPDRGVFRLREFRLEDRSPGGHPDWPDWMTKIHFGGLKQKPLASIVAISAIQVLKAFMNIDVALTPGGNGLAGRRACGVWLPRP